MSPLIAVDQLKRTLDRGKAATLLDVRWALGDVEGRNHYRDAHIPGAVFVDLETELAAHGAPDLGRHPLPAVADFRSSSTPPGGSIATSSAPSGRVTTRSSSARRGRSMWHRSCR